MFYIPHCGVMECELGLKSGIYLIRHRESGKAYVGSAVNFRKRLREHRRLLRLGTHKNRYLQAAWTTHGEAAFEATVLEEVEPTESSLLAAESLWLNCFMAADRGYGYNLCPVAGTRRGAKLSDEACRRIGASKRGNTYRLGSEVPQETRDRIAAKLRGGKASEETKLKLSNMRRGKKHGPEWCAAIGRSNKGRLIPQEVRDRISAKLMGSRMPPETRAKLSAALKAKYAAGYRRQPRSAEHKAKIALMWEKRRRGELPMPKMGRPRKDELTCSTSPAEQRL